MKRKKIDEKDFDYTQVKMLMENPSLVKSKNLEKMMDKIFVLS